MPPTIAKDIAAAVHTSHDQQLSVRNLGSGLMSPFTQTSTRRFFMVLSDSIAVGRKKIAAVTVFWVSPSVLGIPFQHGWRVLGIAPGITL